MIIEPNFRKIDSNFIDVTFEFQNTIVNVGMLNKEEAKELKDILSTYIDDLQTYFLE